MGLIFGLLFVLLPVILKIIAKNLEQSGLPQSKDVRPELTEVFWTEEIKPDNLEEEDLDFYLEPEPTPVPKPVAMQPVVMHVEEKVERHVKQSMLVEEKPKQKEKIDVKKLVVYSEIMKPKYTE